MVPIVKCIGLGLGLCIWGMVNLLSGWSTGRLVSIITGKEVSALNITVIFIYKSLLMLQYLYFSEMF